MGRSAQTAVLALLAVAGYSDAATDTTESALQDGNKRLEETTSLRHSLHRASYCAVLAVTTDMSVVIRKADRHDQMFACLLWQFAPTQNRGFL